MSLTQRFNNATQDSKPIAAARRTVLTVGQMALVMSAAVMWLFLYLVVYNEIERLGAFSRSVAWGPSVRELLMFGYLVPTVGGFVVGWLSVVAVSWGADIGYKRPALYSMAATALALVGYYVVV